jgi:OOP family OmpA-OmpF porin
MSKFNYLLPIALLASSSTFASSEGSSYVGARLGGTHYSDFSSTQVSNGLDKDDLGAGAFLGHNVKDWFALEIGYTYLGKIKFDNNAVIEQDAIDLVGKFSTDLTESIDIFAKLGGSHYMTDGKKSLSSLSDNNLTVTAGLGLEYFFTKHVSTRVEYQYYGAPKLENNGFSADWDTHFYGVSIVYSWGGAPTPVAKPAPVTQPKVVAEPEVVAVVVTTPIVVEKIAEPVVIEALTVQVRFDNNSTEIKQQYIDQLAPIAQHLIDYPEAKLVVIGHTDSQGPENYNQQLSERRATGVAAHLSQVFNINTNRIEHSGLGESEPIASNKTASGRTENRRVSVFTPGLTKLAK